MFILSRSNIRPYHNILGVLFFLLQGIILSRSNIRRYHDILGVRFCLLQGTLYRFE
jgi:hypothetical protein